MEAQQLRTAFYYLDCAKAMMGIGHLDEMDFCIKTAIASLEGFDAEKIFGKDYLHSNISPEQVENVLIALGETLVQKPKTQPLEERVLQPV